MKNRNEIIEFVIDKVEFPNKGKAKCDGRSIKFKGGIEGQKVRAKVGRIRKGIIEAKIIEVVEKSPLEKEPGCEHSGVCGGDRKSVV